MIESGTKRCCTCKALKPTGEFNKESRRKDGLCPKCRDCQRASGKASYQRNRESILAKHAARYNDVKEEKLAYSRSHYQRNKEKILAQHKAWKAANKERRLAKDREWVENNREKANAASKRWVERNPEKRKAIAWNANSKRYKRTRGGPGYKAMQEWADAQEKKCFYCSTDCEDGFEIDHFHPLARGGTHDFENLRISCCHCNRRKHARDPYEFIEWLKSKGGAS